MAVEMVDMVKVCTTPKQQARMARILGVAREAFAENAFHEVLMDDVARSAEVGKGTIYRYFPDKEHLYFAVIFDGLEGLKRHIRSALPEEVDSEALIRELVFSLVSFFRENRFFFRLMNIEDSKVGEKGSLNRRRWGQERSRLIGAIAQVLTQAGATGGIQVVYPRTEAQILMGMIRSVLRYNEDKLTVKQMADEVVRIYMYGMQHGVAV